ncbi:MAG: NfeD family protein, partial [Acidimicrobiales bacterium]
VLVFLSLFALAGMSCAHAGGHAGLVLAPAAVLAVVWAITAASGHEAVAGWWLVGASAALVSVAAALGGAALRARAMPLAKARSVAGAVGVAVTALDPAGVVRVGGETWSAISHSGRLPAGATVHVIAAEGLRLQVWSESGTVPGPEALEPSSDNNPSEQRQGGSQC